MSPNVFKTRMSVKQMCWVKHTQSDTGGGRSLSLPYFRTTVVRWSLIGCPDRSVATARLWLADASATCSTPANRERAPGKRYRRRGRAALAKLWLVNTRGPGSGAFKNIRAHFCPWKHRFTYTAKPEDSMDKTNIVTCTAPVNIAVIKYCKCHLELCLALCCFEN